MNASPEPGRGHRRLRQTAKSRPAALWVPAGWIGSGLIRLVRSSVRLRFEGREHIGPPGSPCVFAFWHRHLLLMVYGAPPPPLAVWTSQSDAGELITRAVGHFGVTAARGSNSRGGLAALQAMVRLGKQGHTLCVAPDGPRGPASEVKPGALMIAILAGLPILPVAYAARRAWRAPGWDGLVVPRPFSTVQFVYGAPMTLERGSDLLEAGAELKRRLDGAEQRALALLGVGPRGAAERV
jgi:hypothetical protein